MISVCKCFSNLNVYPNPEPLRRKSYFAFSDPSFAGPYVATRDSVTGLQRRIRRPLHSQPAPCASARLEATAGEPDLGPQRVRNCPCSWGGSEPCMGYKSSCVLLACRYQHWPRRSHQRGIAASFLLAGYDRSAVLLCIALTVLQLCNTSPGGRVACSAELEPLARLGQPSASGSREAATAECLGLEQVCSKLSVWGCCGYAGLNLVQAARLALAREGNGTLPGGLAPVPLALLGCHTPSAVPARQQAHRASTRSH